MYIQYVYIYKLAGQLSTAAVYKLVGCLLLGLYFQDPQVIKMYMCVCVCVCMCVHVCVCVCVQGFGGTELRRFCEGFFLQNMEELLEREDFHRLVLEAPPPLLSGLEETLVERLCSFHPTCRK